ncbi:MAG: hypothetical protein IJ449_13495 [Clostridia bacterium]|nr:hypothetical protein [Clostridia bacterium]
MKRLWILLCFAAVVLGCVSCGDTAAETGAVAVESLSDEPIFDEEETAYWTFEEIVAQSNRILLAKYIEPVEHETYAELKFRVSDVLSGATADEYVYLYQNEASRNLPFEAGNTYILITEKLESIMYEHDRYLLMDGLYLCTDSETYLRNGESIAIPDGMNIFTYLDSLCEHPSEAVPMSEETVTYENAIEEMVHLSDFVAVVNIDSLYTEATNANNNTYRCTVKELLSGEGLNTYRDGSIILSILKNTVEVGKSYIVGFSPVDENSLIYRQETVESVYADEENMINEVKAYIK